MVIFVVLDCLLKISATESKLLVQYDRDRETVWRASPTPCDNDNEHFSIDGQVDDADAELIRLGLMVFVSYLMHHASSRGV